MRFHKLRIAWSVLWGLLAVLLCVMWVRSYWRLDCFYVIKNNAIDINGVNNGGISLSSVAGHVNCGVETSPYFWLGDEVEVDSRPNDGTLDPMIGANGFAFSRDKYAIGGIFVKCPYSVPVLLCVAFATFPWLRWRFSLRTLLIATTLAAVVLGLVVWEIRRI